MISRIKSNAAVKKCHKSEQFVQWHHLTHLIVPTSAVNVVWHHWSFWPEPDEEGGQCWCNDKHQPQEGDINHEEQGVMVIIIIYDKYKWMNVTAEEKLLLLLRTILTYVQPSSDANILDENTIQSIQHVHLQCITFYRIYKWHLSVMTHMIVVTKV